MPAPKAEALDPGTLAMARSKAAAGPVDLNYAEDPNEPGIAPFGSDFLGARRLVFYLCLTLVLMPVQALFVALGTRLAESFPVAYHRICCRLRTENPELTTGNSN